MRLRGILKGEGVAFGQRSLILLKKVAIQNQGKDVYLDISWVESRDASKMVRYYFGQVLPSLVELTGEYSKPLDIWLVKMFGFGDRPVTEYSFDEMKIFLASLENFFEI